MVHIKALSLFLFDVWKLSLYRRNRKTPTFQSAHLQTLYLHTDTQMTYLPILGADVGQDILVKELEHQRDAVGKHQMLTGKLKLNTQMEHQMLTGKLKLNTQTEHQMLTGKLKLNTQTEQ